MLLCLRRKYMTIVFRGLELYIVRLLAQFNIQLGLLLKETFVKSDNLRHWAWKICTTFI